MQALWRHVFRADARYAVATIMLQEMREGELKTLHGEIAKEARSTGQLKKPRTCVFHSQDSEAVTLGSNPYYVCSKPAKFVTPDGKDVCGMHRYHYDRSAERWGRKKCKPILHQTTATTET